MLPSFVALLLAIVISSKGCQGRLCYGCNYTLVRGTLGNYLDCVGAKNLSTFNVISCDNFCVTTRYQDTSFITVYYFERTCSDTNWGVGCSQYNSTITQCSSACLGDFCNGENGTPYLDKNIPIGPYIQCYSCSYGIDGVGDYRCVTSPAAVSSLVTCAGNTSSCVTSGIYSSDNSSEVVSFTRGCSDVPAGSQCLNQDQEQLNCSTSCSSASFCNNVTGILSESPPHNTISSSAPRITTTKTPTTTTTTPTTTTTTPTTTTTTPTTTTTTPTTTTTTPTTTTTTPTTTTTTPTTTTTTPTTTTTTPTTTTSTPTTTTTPTTTIRTPTATTTTPTTNTITRLSSTSTNVAKTSTVVLTSLSSSSTTTLSPSTSSDIASIVATMQQTSSFTLVVGQTRPPPTSTITCYACSFNVASSFSMGYECVTNPGKLKGPVSNVMTCPASQYCATARTMKIAPGNVTVLAIYRSCYQASYGDGCGRVSIHGEQQCATFCSTNLCNGLDGRLPVVQPPTSRARELASTISLYVILTSLYFTYQAVL